MTGQLSKYWSCLFNVYNNMLLTQLTFSSTELKSGIRIENIQTGKQISSFSIDLQRILYIWANCTSIEIDGKKMLYIVKSNRMKWQWMKFHRFESNCGRLCSEYTPMNPIIWKNSGKLFFFTDTGWWVIIFFYDSAFAIIRIEYSYLTFRKNTKNHFNFYCCINY